MRPVGGIGKPTPARAYCLVLYGASDHALRIRSRAGTGQLPVRGVYPLLTGLRWLVATRASFSGGFWTRQLSARCSAQHAVDHHINSEAKPFAGVSSDQLSGVGSN